MKPQNLRSSLRLYAVTPCNCALKEVRAVLDGGATFLQLREKELPFEAFVEKAKALRAICPEGIPYVINDNLEVALSSGADGVHIGQGDGSVEEARRRLGAERILGVSVGTVEEAVRAEQDGADYLGVGTLFPTNTKADAQRVSFETLHAICASVTIPVVGIGGIGEENLMELAGSGIVGVALVSALFTANARESTKRLDGATRAMVSVPREVRCGALVDMDGTVLDSMWVWEAIDREMVEAYHVANREAVLRHLATIVHLREGMEYLHDQCGIGDSVEALCEEFVERLRVYYEKKVVPFPGAMEALQKMRGEGVRMALVTATKESLARKALERTGLGELFDEQAFDVSKRAPTAFYRVLDCLGVGVMETTVYDDMPSVREMAESAGFRAAETV